MAESSLKELQQKVDNLEARLAAAEMAQSNLADLVKLSVQTSEQLTKLRKDLGGAMGKSF